MNKPIIITLSFLGFLFVLLPPFQKAHAQESMVFDSTDNYIGGCMFTNKSSWGLTKELNVSKIQIWYKWNQGETTLPVKVYKDGDAFAEFTAVRGNCDPYQTTWCNADYTINKVFPEGNYSTEIPESRQCMKPGSTGTVRLYSGTTEEPTVLPTVEPTQVITPVPTQVPTTEVRVIEQKPTGVVPTCKCDQVTLYAAAGGISFAVSLLTSLIFKKR